MFSYSIFFITISASQYFLSTSSTCLQLETQSSSVTSAMASFVSCITSVILKLTFRLAMYPFIVAQISSIELRSAWYAGSLRQSCPYSFKMLSRRKLGVGLCCLKIWRSSAFYSVAPKGICCLVNQACMSAFLEA